MRTHMDVFSGIGGFALAARQAGMQTLQFVEIEPFCQAVLKKNFPGVPIHGDAKTLDARPFRGRIDILTGGFPCQPHSVAGQKKGRDDDRNLWPDLIRIVRDCRPLVCLFENVPNLANTMLHECLRDLDGAGYKAEVYCVAAEDIGASHRRERLWIVAYSKSISQRKHANGTWQSSEGRQNTFAGSEAMADALCPEWRQDASRRINEPNGADTRREEAAGRPELLSSAMADADEAGRSQPGRQFSGAEFLCSSQCGREAMADAPCFTAGEPNDATDAGTDGRNTWGISERGGLPVCTVGNSESDDRTVLYRSEWANPNTGRTCLPLFPPARNDYRGWSAVASVDASLMPCAERAVRNVDDGIPPGLVRRRRSARNATLKALGNAIVPQIAYLFITGIMETLA